jgi:hypothetical protein
VTDPCKHVVTVVSGATDPLSSGSQLRRWYSADLLYAIGRVAADDVAELFELDRVVRDEFVINGAVLDERVAEAVHQRDVRSRLELQMKIGASRDRQHPARINHDHLRPQRPALGARIRIPQNGALLGGVVADQHDALGVVEILVRPRVGPERLHQRRSRRRGAEPGIRIDGGDAQPRECDFANRVVLLEEQLARCCRSRHGLVRLPRSPR